MLAQAILLGAFLVAGGHGNFYSDLDALPDSHPFSGNSWNWRSSYHWPENRRTGEDSGEVQSRRYPADRREDVETISAESREPLSPDFKDPNPRPSDSKPESRPPKPSYNPSILPGGVLDIGADGFGYPNIDLPQFPDIHGNFGFGVGAHSGESRPPGNGGGLFGLGGFFGTFGEHKPWWKGDNVCIEREESTDDEDDEEEAAEVQKNATETEKVPNFFSTSISLSNCQQTPKKYECVTKINNHGVVKTFTVRYKCCYGFERSEGSTGCNKQIELKSLPATIDSLEGKDFKTMIDIARLNDKIVNENYTIFLPTDTALTEFEDKMNWMNSVELARRRRDAVDTTELVKNHLVAGFVDLGDYSNEELINSENNNKTIRINIYPTRTPTKMITANCVPVQKANNLAKNGIVHVLNGVMQPADNSVTEIIEMNPKLSGLRQVLENTNLTSYFKEDGHYTVFAPTDEAFDKLDDISRQKILNGNACAANILKHHIVANTICSAAIIGNATTHNIVGDILNMERTDENKLIIEGKSIIEKRDIIGTNGVIHLVDTLIIPDTALYLNDALKTNNLTKFQELVKAADFETEMDNFENATVFAPTNEALSTPEAKKYLEEIGEDKEKLRAFVKFHTVKGELETNNMENNAMLPTESEGQSLRVNLYSTLPLFANIVNRATVNCARIVNFDMKSCGSIIHEVDKILLPSEKSIFEIIKEDEKFSTLIKVMEGTDIEEILKDNKRSITFAAPDDEAFKNIDAADLKTLMEDKEKAALVLKNHILSEVLCCAGVGPQTFGFNSFVPTLSGQHQQVSRSGNRQVRIGRASVTKCDSTATNGVVHVINRVLFPQRPHNPHFGFFLFDL